MGARSRGNVAVTIHDVAARAGVSIKTVSRVLNHEPRVTEETRTRVQAVVAELGYSPNPAARNLSSAVGTTIGLGFAVRLEDERPAGQQYTLGLELGALAACQRLGFGLLLLPCDALSPRAAEALLARAQQRRVAGVVLASPLDAAPGVLDALRAAGLPWSCLNANVLDGDMPCVAVDDRRAAARLVTELVRLGHRSIGFVGGFEGTRTARDRRAGYLDALQAAGLPAPARWRADGAFSFASGRAAAERLLALEDRPTAVFAANDDMAIGVMHAALARGLRIPHDLSVVGFDDIESARLMWPSLSTSRQPLNVMAQVAVEQVAARLFPQRLDVPQHPAARIFECELVMRDSAGPPPGTGRQPSALR